MTGAGEQHKHDDAGGLGRGPSTGHHSQSDWSEIHVRFRGLEPEQTTDRMFVKSLLLLTPDYNL